MLEVLLNIAKYLMNYEIILKFYVQWWLLNSKFMLHDHLENFLPVKWMHLSDSPNESRVDRYIGTYLFCMWVNL